MRSALIRIDNKACASFRSRTKTEMPESPCEYQKNSKPIPCVRHRSHASSLSFSGNCRAKFGRKLTNLSETTADDTDNAEETPGRAPVLGAGKGVPPPRSTYTQGFWHTQRGSHPSDIKAVQQTTRSRNYGDLP